MRPFRSLDLLSYGPHNPLAADTEADMHNTAYELRQFLIHWRDTTCCRKNELRSHYIPAGVQSLTIHTV
jgi:hypothetical protein